jgi:hypothetical protein
MRQIRVSSTQEPDMKSELDQYACKYQDLLLSRPEECQYPSISQSEDLHPQFASRNPPFFYSEDRNFATREFNRYALPPRIPETRDVSVNADFLPPLSGLRSIALRRSGTKHSEFKLPRSDVPRCRQLAISLPRNLATRAAK